MADYTESTVEPTAAVPPPMLLVKNATARDRIDRFFNGLIINRKGLHLNLLLKDTLPPLPDMLLEPPDKPEKLLHPDHAHEDLDMDLAMRPVLLGQRLLWLDMDHELEPVYLCPCLCCWVSILI
jgi:hypothetical protein